MLGDWAMERRGSIFPGALSAKPEYLHCVARRLELGQVLAWGHPLS